MRSPLSWKRVFHVRQRIPHDRHGGGVLAQFGGYDLVEGIGCSMVIVEVVPTVLQNAKCWNTRIRHSRNIGTGRIVARLQGRSANSVENRKHGSQEIGRTLGNSCLEPKRVRSARVAFDGSY